MPLRASKAIITVGLASSKAFSRSRNTTKELWFRGLVMVCNSMVKAWAVEAPVVKSYMCLWSGPTFHLSLFRTILSASLERHDVREIGR